MKQHETTLEGTGCLKTDGGHDGHTDYREFSKSSVFVRLLETPGRVKILDTLIRRPESKLTAGEIAKQGSLSESSFSRNKDFLLELGIMSTIEQGSKTRYQINKENDFVQLLVAFHNELLYHADEILAGSNNDRINAIEAAYKTSEGSEKESETVGDGDPDELSRFLAAYSSG